MDTFNITALLTRNGKKHKNKPVQFQNLAGGVQKRREENLKYRRSMRNTLLDNIRNISEYDTTTVNSVQNNPLSKAEHRKEQLEKWKAERERNKKMAAAQKKKPFLFGIVRAPLTYVPPPKPSTSGRVTRSQASNSKAEPKISSFAPNNAQFRPRLIPKMKIPVFHKYTKREAETEINFDPVIPNTIVPKKQLQSKNIPIKPGKDSKEKKLDVEKSVVQSKNIPKKPGKQNKEKKLDVKKSIVVTRAMAKNNKEVNEIVQTTKSVNKKNLVDECTPKKNIIPKSESNSEEKLRSPNLDDEQKTPEVPLKISPFVTRSRGKDNARMEMKKKIEEGLLDDDTSDVDSVVYLRRQLNSEIQRITEMCETWERILENNMLPEHIQEMVLGAVGQARLLMTKKFQQFANLISRCACPEPSTALVTPADLHGFWDMVYMQVENIDLRFKKLQDLRARNWCEEESQPTKKIQRNKCGITKKNVIKTGPSRLREMIAAARKNKIQKVPTEELPVLLPMESEVKNFEGGFFSVKSPVKTPSESDRTPIKNNSLLKAVLTNEVQKSASAMIPFAILRASKICKDIEIDGVSPLPATPLSAIDLKATPAKSILKSRSKNNDSYLKKMVNFDNSLENIEKVEDSKINVQMENKENTIFRVLTRKQRLSLNTSDVPAETSITETTEHIDESKVEKGTVRRRRSRRRVHKEENVSGA